MLTLRVRYDKRIHKNGAVAEQVEGRSGRALINTKIELVKLVLFLFDLFDNFNGLPNAKKDKKNSKKFF